MANSSVLKILKILLLIDMDIHNEMNTYTESSFILINET